MSTLHEMELEMVVSFCIYNSFTFERFRLYHCIEIKVLGRPKLHKLVIFRAP